MKIWAQLAQGRYKTGVPENYGDLPGNSAVKNPPANARDRSSITESGRSYGGGNGNPLQYSCFKNSIFGGLLSMESQRVRHDWAHTQSNGGRSDVRQRSSMWETTQDCERGRMQHLKAEQRKGQKANLCARPRRGRV